MKIGLLQLNSTIGDFAANRQKLVAGYEKACALGAEFALAPELFLCGYPPGCAQGSMQHRPFLCHVDLLAAEHCLDALLHARLVGKAKEQAKSLIDHAILGVV